MHTGNAVVRASGVEVFPSGPHFVRGRENMTAFSWDYIYIWCTNMCKLYFIRNTRLKCAYYCQLGQSDNSTFTINCWKHTIPENRDSSRTEFVKTPLLKKKTSIYIQLIFYILHIFTNYRVNGFVPKCNSKLNIVSVSKCNRKQS